MKNLLLLMSLFVCSQSLCAQAQSTPFRCKNQRHVINLSLNNSGQTVEGPACAQITINALRYSAEFGKTMTYSSGPSIGSIFPSSFSPGGGGPNRGQQRDLEDQFNAETHYLYEILMPQLLLRESMNRTTSAAIDQYLALLKTQIGQSDELLVVSGPKVVLALFQGTHAEQAMDNMFSEAANWKNTDSLVANIQMLQADLNSLPIDFPNNAGTITGDPCSSTNIKLLGWSDWSKCRDSPFKMAQLTAVSLLTDANQWTSDSDKAAGFAKKVGLIQYWKTIVASLTEDSFVRQAEVECGVLFNRNEQATLKLIIADRTALFDGQTPQPQTKDQLLTVTCSSPFSVSAGVAFSTIENREFAIVKSAPPPGDTNSVNTFGTTSDSRVNPYPIAIAHARLHSWQDNRYALHFSFGVGGNVKGQTSGGSNPEFLTGLSLSFFRTIYLTGGLDIGKQSELAGGFKLGGTVPPDITSPPVSSSYRPGFGFAITFTKP